MTPALIQQLKAARRVSVPIVAINTPDAAATIKAIDSAITAVPMLQWDVVEGLRHVNEAGKELRAAVVGEMDTTIGNPVAMLQLAKKMQPKSVLFVHLANRFVADPMTMQAAWNLRDEFKRDQRMLVLLSIASDWPAELAGDVVVLDEPLPDAAALRDLISKLHGDAGLLPDSEGVADFEVELVKSVEAVQGLPAFQAEQVVAMSLTKKGIDVAALWERKRKQIELTPGLKVYRDATTFADIGGVGIVKDFLSRVMKGNARPNAVVFVDEIEKFLAGSAGGAADSSGVSQDQLGQLLSYMQDTNATGMIFVGPPGAAKSAVAKAAGNEGGIPTIQLDLGAMKGSLVGASEQAMRSALKVITSVSNGRSLWIATCNSISDLPPELRRRFTLGTYFFDLPDPVERAAIWQVWLPKYGFTTTAHIPAGGLGEIDIGWTGAEIRQCCDIAWRLACPLKEAAGYVVPVSKSAAEQLDKLRRAAEGRFLSASRPGVYRREQQLLPANDRRNFELED